MAWKRSSFSMSRTSRDYGYLYDPRKGTLSHRGNHATHMPNLPVDVTEAMMCCLDIPRVSVPTLVAPVWKDAIRHTTRHTPQNQLTVTEHPRGTTSETMMHDPRIFQHRVSVCAHMSNMANARLRDILQTFPSFFHLRPCLHFKRRFVET